MHWQLIGVVLVAFLPFVPNSLAVGDFLPCGQNSTASRGYFSSPNFPLNFPAGAKCQWSLQAPTGTYFWFSFEFPFILPCDADGTFLQFDQLLDGEWVLMGRKCGTLPPSATFTSSGNVVRVIFQGESPTTKGFRTIWIHTEPPPAAPSVKVNGTTVNSGIVYDVKAGDTLDISCTVEGGEPTVDSVTLDATSDGATNETIGTSTSMTMKVTKSHNNTQVVCSADHLSGNYGKQTVFTLHIASPSATREEEGGESPENSMSREELIIVATVASFLTLLMILSASVFAVKKCKAAKTNVSDGNNKGQGNGKSRHDNI